MQLNKVEPKAFKGTSGSRHRSMCDLGAQLTASWNQLYVSKQRREPTQARPTYGIGCGNRTWATLVGGKCSNHCATPAPRFMFRENCMYSEHVGAKLFKVNNCLFVLRSSQKEGFGQEVYCLFSTLVLPNFTYGMSVYGAVDSDLTIMQNRWIGAFKGNTYLRKWTCETFWELQIFKLRSVDPDCPLSIIILKKKETKS